MSNHYYSKEPEVQTNRQIWTTSLRDTSMKFITDTGVFSKSSIDYGSRLLIDTLILAESDRILDVGCGYGPIGLSAALLAPKGHVTMVDINERAVSLAKENAKLNRITNVTIEQSDLFEEVRQHRFNVILTNPPIRAGKAVVHRIFEEGYALLEKQGVMWVVIQKKQGAPSARAKLESMYDEVELMAKAGGYHIIRAKK